MSREIVLLLALSVSVILPGNDGENFSMNRFYDDQNEVADARENLLSAYDSAQNENETENPKDIGTESDCYNQWDKSQNETSNETEWRVSNEKSSKSESENETESKSESETETESKSGNEAENDQNIEKDILMKFFGYKRTVGLRKTTIVAPQKPDSLPMNSSETIRSRITDHVASPSSETSSSGRSGTAKRSLRNGQESSNQSCETLQCLRGGACSLNGDRSARCRCPMASGGNRCQEDVIVRQPRFHGSGYIAVPAPRATGSTPFSVTMSFRPDAATGMLIFASSSSSVTLDKMDHGGHSDFFSLALINAFVVLRFDCGSGVVQISSTNRVEVDHWNTIHARQWKRNGMVRLNDGPVARNTAKGSFTELTFGHVIFLGGHPNATDPLLRRTVGLDLGGPDAGLVGCVRSIRINGRPYDLRRDAFIGDTVYGMDVDDCHSELCANVTCLNGGKPSPNVRQTNCQCLCPLGTIGDNCQSKVDIYIPLFSGHSFLRHQSLGRSVLIRMDIELIVKASNSNGLLLYNAFSPDRTSDFLLLSINDGFILFAYDLGTGPVLIRSRQRILVNEWHEVRLMRNGRHGQLIVDGHPSVDAMSPGPFTQLNVMLDLFIGGHPDLEELPKVMEVNESFTGCIQMVRVNQRRLFLIDEAIEGINIDNCNHPCVGQPCAKAALCVPLRDLYQCLSCPADDATNCEDGNILHRYRYRYRRELLPVTLPMFNGSSFIEYSEPRLIKLSRGHQTDVDLVLRASSPDGLILWMGEEQTDTDSDFLSIGLSGGFVQLRFNLGSGEVTMTWTEFRIYDNKWHRVTARRFEQQGSLDVDGLRLVTGNSSGPLKQLNTRPSIFLGGMRDIKRQTLGRFRSGFIGCVSNLTLDSDMRVNLIADAMDVVNVTQCDYNTNSINNIKEDNTMG